MSHTTRIGETTFIHSSDLSGKVEIRYLNGLVATSISGAEIVGLVAHALRLNDLPELATLIELRLPHLPVTERKP